MNNYNYLNVLKYKSSDNDTLFRKEFLECFNLKEYSNDINNLIYDLYSDVKEYYVVIIDKLKKTNKLCSTLNLEDKDCFKVLFSWDLLHHNHLLLNAIGNTNKDNTNNIDYYQNELLLNIV